MRIAIALLVGAMALAGCSPKAEQPEAHSDSSSGDANAEIVPTNPFFGKWQLVRAQVAPWWDGKGEEPVADKDFTVVEFDPKKSSGAPIVTCTQPRYSVSIASPAGLFQGNLKEPFVQARALGFPINGGEIRSLSFYCEDNAKDVSLDFAMLADDTIMVGLDNVIYTMQRAPN